MDPNTSIEIELIKYFKIMYDGEKKLDISRKVLCENEEYSPEYCFALIDTEGNNFISEIDICNFLNDQEQIDYNDKTNTTNVECYKLIRTYDSTDESHLLYEE